MSVGLHYLCRQAEPPRSGNTKNEANRRKWALYDRPLLCPKAAGLVRAAGVHYANRERPARWLLVVAQLFVSRRTLLAKRWGADVHRRRRLRPLLPRDREGSSQPVEMSLSARSVEEPVPFRAVPLPQVVIESAVRLASGLGRGYGEAMLTRHAARGAIVFGGAGALSRFTFRRFETRWEIAIFCAAALGYQLAVRPALGRRVSPATAALDLVCITGAVVAVKVAVEGHL